ncbi:hypothetical protein [Wolbachia endosymbiont of Mansonella perstans]|uniref:hypothetical protein n=1 Tax=Wolbachia endosymbiont of Mansonella perstans TaxID=229526 RepID=UPI001CE0AF3E|nr:hypothetical protein [Wolbachia endosymbiont of Mansonella perstans]
MGTLADEFGYFDDQDKLRYYNYHKSADGNTYGPENFSVKNDKCGYEQNRQILPYCRTR